MNSDAITKLADIFTKDYESWLERTDYVGLSLADMLAQLIKTSWQKEYEKFMVRNSIILKSRGFDIERLQPAWYLARMFTGGPPAVSAVSSIYRSAFG